MSAMFQLILCDIDSRMADAYRKAFEGTEVIVVQDDILALKNIDCYVNAANSYGIMGAGIAGALSRQFGDPLIRAVFDDVHDNWGGKTPVGCASLVCPFDDGPDFIMAPTMERPGTDVSKTNNAYLAAYATFELLQAWAMEHYTVVMPGMGTNIGRMDPEECAWQVRKAWDDIFENQGDA